MTQDKKETIYAAILTVLVVYYCIRLFSFIYLIPQVVSVADVKSRPAIEQPHIRAELKRKQRHEIKSSDTSVRTKW